ncbi:hypothetical protein GCM10023075_09350 [Streptosporangium album]
MTRILLVAAFAAGLSACSADDSSSASSAVPTISASSAGPETASASVSAEPTDPAASPEPTAGAQDKGDGGGDSGPAAYLLGELSASPAQPGQITVQIGDGDTQQVRLSPTATVLDTRGTICKTGKAPHKCTVAQLEKALNARKFPYAKVTLKGEIAVRVEAIDKG